MRAARRITGMMVRSVQLFPLTLATCNTPFGVARCREDNGMVRAASCAAVRCLQICEECPLKTEIPTLQLRDSNRFCRFAFHIPAPGAVLGREDYVAWIRSTIAWKGDTSTTYATLLCLLRRDVMKYKAMEAFWAMTKSRTLIKVLAELPEFTISISGEYVQSQLCGLNDA
eukprot:gene14162-biopygen10022